MMLLDQNVVIELIKVLPSVLWVILTFIVFLLFYKPFVSCVLPYVSSLKIGNIEVVLGKFEASLSKVIEIAEKNPQWNVHVPIEDKKQVIRRIQRNRDVLRGSNLLIFDDRPETLENEINMLQQLEIKIETAISLDEVKQKLIARNFDILISDIARPLGQPNGIITLQILHEQTSRIPTVFYIANFDKESGIPVGAIGITNRPDELVHLILDILERKNL